MTTSESTLPRLQQRLARWIPLDVVVAWVAAAGAATVALRGSPGAIRFWLVVPLLFFLPGYLLVAALFPHRQTAAGHGPTLFGAHDRLAFRERVALSFGLSVALLPIVGIAIAASPFPLRAPAIVVALLSLLVLLGLIAAVRRRRLPREARFRLPIAQWIAEARTAVGTGPGLDRALNVVVIASVLLALGSVGFALAVPQDGEQFTDFAVVNSDGENLVAGEYPDRLTAGESTTLVTAVENREGASEQYTVVITAERPAGTGDGAAEEELQRFQATVDDGERWTEVHDVAPTITGNRVRINYYLYRGDAPEDPGPETAYRHLFLWLSVIEEFGGA